MKTIFSLFTVLVGLFLNGQDVQQEIDRQVWTRFTTAWEINDAAAFNSVHAADVVRIGSKGLMIGEEYLDFNRKNMSMQESSADRKIEFAFDYRQVKGDIAYEMGFYRVTSKRSSKPYIARFHVELRKVDGEWKIARDYDSNMIGNQAVNQAMYDGLEFFHFE